MKERRGEMYVKKKSKVERDGKSRDKVNESHEESGLLIKTYGGSRKEGERSIYSSEKAAGPRHRAISRRAVGAMINSLPARSAKKPATRRRTVFRRFPRSRINIQMRRDILGHASHPQSPGTRRV